MLHATCQCGAVQLTVAARPDYLHECNCTFCRKSGARWGYFHPDQVNVGGATATFSRRDKDEASAVLHFCPTCGSTTHFTLSKSAQSRFGNTMLGVNLRLADEGQLAGIELRYPNGAAWDGAGAFDYVREPRVLC